MVDVLVRYRGVILLLPILVTMAWLGISEKLNLFIHPRYILFTIIFTVLGFAAVTAVAVTVARRRAVSRSEGLKPVQVAAYGLSLLLSVSMLVVAPTALTSSLAPQTSVNSGPVSTLSSQLNEEDWRSFSVKDWSSLVSKPAAFSYADKTVELTGFVTPINDDSFYLSRYVISCCAVDAQPVGVPVIVPNWQQQVQPGDWVQVTGVFTPSSLNPEYYAALQPSAPVVSVTEPKDPYDY